VVGKRFSVLLLAAAVLAGCGGDEGGGDEEAAPPPAKKLKVGLVTDLGQLSDRGFNQLAYEGLKRAERTLGVQGRVFQSATPADYIPNMTTMAKQKFDLIIGVGFAQGDAVAKTAARFPDRRFAIIDVDQASLAGKPDNVIGLLFREEEVGYLAGYLAALTEKRRPGRDVISSVGGMKEPPVDRFIAGYQAGARKAVPGVEVLNGYSQDWDDQAKCKELALNQIARGAGVVFQVAGGCGLGALDAAGDRDVWGVGVDADQSFLGPHILTSAQKKVDRAVFLTIQDILDGRWRAGRNLTFGLEQGGVGLGKISPRASRADRAAVKKIEQQIVDGEITGLPTTVG
jgi:basic membrane protein A and related proteins